MNAGEREWPDLRLAGLAAGAWLSALAGLYLSGRTGAVLAATAGALAGAGWWWLSRSLVGLAPSEPAGRAPSRRAHGRRAGWAVLTVLLGILAGAGCTAARVAVRDAPPLSGLAHQRTTVRATLVVTDDPHAVHTAPGRQPEFAVPADLVEVHEPVRVRLSVRILVLAADPAWRSLLPGQQVVATGRLASPRGGDLRAALLSATGPPAEVGTAPWVQRAAGRLRAGLQRACAPLPRDAGGLLPGLVVGDTSRLEPAVADNFRATGMTHLVAVSGSNVAVLLGLVLGLVRWCRAGPRLAAAVCVLALVGFVILVRPSPSVLRAAAMGGLGLLGLALGRPSSAIPGLAAVVTLLVLVDPELAGDAGFALSALATAGLLLVAPGWRDALRRRGVPQGLAEALAVPAAAQLMCAPVIAGLSATVGVVAVPANLVAVPAVPAATVLGVCAAVLSPVWPAGAGFAAWLAGWPARWLVLVARYGAETPAGNLPWPGGVAGGLLLAGVLLVVLLLGRHAVVRRLACVVAVAATLGALPVRLVAGGWPPTGWLMVVCDVGQGDAVVLPAGPGDAVVVDAGPDPAPTDGCLRRIGVHHVALLVVSHFHADHVGGVAGVFRGRAVAGVLTCGYGEPAIGRTAVLAASTGVPMSVASPGTAYAVGDLRLTVLGPVRPLTGTRSDPNNNSVVLRATVGGRVLLLPGDAEEDEQQTLLDAVGPGGLHADVLKVAHHGSAYQDPAFLDAVSPAVALVSVGAGNAYGHPNPAVLARLVRGGARVVRTDESGDVAAVARGGELAVVARGHDPGRHPP